MKYLILSIALLTAACASPLTLQRNMASLSKSAVAECKRSIPRCRQVEPCQAAALDALRTLQRWNEARAAGAETPTDAADALAAEAAARVTCATAGVR